jgi:hypothetical protein
MSIRRIRFVGQSELSHPTKASPNMFPAEDWQKLALSDPMAYGLNRVFCVSEGV